METAAAIGGALHRSPRVLADLTEIDFGAWTGRSFGDLTLVSHGDVIKSVLAHVLGAGLDHMPCFDVDPACVSTIVDEGGRWRVVSVNENPAPAHERIQKTNPPALHRAEAPR